MKKIITIILFSLLLCGCGATIEGITFNESIVKMGDGDEYDIEYSVYPENGNKSSIKFVSSDENIVTVNKNKIEALKEGNCTIFGLVNEKELSSFSVEVHSHDWEEIFEVVHHEDDGHFEAWDEIVIDKSAWDEVVVDKKAWSEQVIDTPAWDEVVVDKEAWDETVIDTPAWDETVIDTPAWDETVIDTPAWDEKIIDKPYSPAEYYDINECNKCGRTYGVGDNGSSGKRCSSPVCNGIILHRRWQIEEEQQEVSHIVHHEAITHIVHHETTYKTITHPAETHTIHHDAITHTVHHDTTYKTVTHPEESHIVHHDAITHIVHHDAIYDKKDFKYGNNDYWVIDKPAWDENVLIGYKCRICEKTKDNEEGLKYIEGLSQ